MDLAEVNGRVFVNNVSLGVYAEAVQSAGYRDAKLRTLADTVPTVLGPGGEALDLRFTGADSRDRKTGAVVMVSNDRYRLGRVLGSGTRPRLDAGELGITVAGEDASGGAKKRVEEWSAPSFEIRSDGPVAAGIDGEAAKLDPPLRFRTRPQALRVRIAPQHPGASPSAAMPEGQWDAIRAVLRIAIERICVSACDHDQQTAPDLKERERDGDHGGVAPEDWPRGCAEEEQAAGHICRCQSGRWSRRPTSARVRSARARTDEWRLEHHKVERDNGNDYGGRHAPSLISGASSARQ